MIAKDLLYAILLGFPHELLNHLPQPWPHLAALISWETLLTQDPVEALRTAFSKLNDKDLRQLRYYFRLAYQVSQISDLTPRQQEALLALRMLGAVSLTNLACAVSRDRGNLHHCLADLIEKGLVIKLLRPGGLHYFAVNSQLSTEAVREIDAFIDDLKLQAHQFAQLPPLEQVKLASSRPWPLGLPNSTKTTKATNSTIDTKSQPTQILLPAVVPIQQKERASSPLF